jgi:DNA-binding HxlR family transcriptional regulator
MVRRTKTAVRAAPRATRLRGSESGRPIVALLDLLGRRWQLRILWELRGSPLKFRPLQAACGELSPTIVNRRLAELKAARLVEPSTEGYRLTRLGRDFEVAFAPLYGWSKAWSEAVDAERKK